MNCFILALWVGRSSHRQPTPWLYLSMCLNQPVSKSHREKCLAYTKRKARTSRKWARDLVKVTQQIELCITFHLPTRDYYIPTRPTIRLLRTWHPTNNTYTFPFSLTSCSRKKTLRAADDYDVFDIVFLLKRVLC